MYFFLRLFSRTWWILPIFFLPSRYIPRLNCQNMSSFHPFPSPFLFPREFLFLFAPNSGKKKKKEDENWALYSTFGVLCPNGRFPLSSITRPKNTFNKYLSRKYKYQNLICLFTMIGSSYLLKVCVLKLCESPSNPLFPKGGPEKRRGENRWWRGCQKANERKKGGNPVVWRKRREEITTNFLQRILRPLMAEADIFLLSRKKKKIGIGKGGKEMYLSNLPLRERERDKKVIGSLSEEEGKGWVENFLLSALSYLLSFSPCFYLFPFL